MVPRSDATHYSGTGQLFRYQTNDTGLGLQATLHLPGGARILSLQLDYYDTSLTGEVLAELDVCSYDGSSCVPQYGFLSCNDALVTACSGNVNAPGWSNAYADLSGADLVVDNYLSGYRILAGNTTNDGGTAIWRVLVGYLLQVSPDPPLRRSTTCRPRTRSTSTSRLCSRLRSPRGAAGTTIARTPR